jgi:hypothetical protein
MNTIRLTTRGKIVIAVLALLAVIAGVYATTPEECRNSDTNRTAVCAAYLQ